MNFFKLKPYAPAIVRIGLSCVFLWFGINQIVHPADWVGWIPSFATHLAEAKTLVLINGLFESIFGFLLLFGIYTRVVSGLLALHLMGITFSVGLNEIGVRDFGLFMAVVSVFLHGPDLLCRDAKNKQ